MAEPAAKPLPGVPARVAILAVRGYQRLLSPLLGTNCRFHPTCSTYALEALERFGVVRGGWLALRRMLRCHPFHPGGCDPVPERFRWGSGGIAGPRDRE